jgi:hypothetical protein
LYPLRRLAEKHGCAILLVRHLNKRGGSRAIYRGGGSIAFVGTCRSGWLIARDPCQPERCILVQMKHNLAAAQPSLAYRITTQENGPPLLSWLGTSAWTADQLLSSGGGVDATQRDRASDFLATFLADGPRTSRDIWSAALEQDVAKRTIERAKVELDIRSMVVGSGPNRRSYWLLPGQSLPENVTPNDAETDLEPWLAPLREQFPPATPLDDL